MSVAVLEKMIAGFMAIPMPQHAFCWQGGEPTLMGLDFYQRVIELQKKYGHAGASVANALQTNGTLFDDAFARHLAEYHFLVGVSLDGPENLHNRFRRDADGRGSFAKVMQGIECLRRNGVAFNILTLVTATNAPHALEIYRFFRDAGFRYHQYIPCVEFDESGKPLPFSVSAEAWGTFLSTLFDEWINRDVGRISVRLFDSILSRMLTASLAMCSMDTNCCQYFVVEHNGDIYPCDFFVANEFLLGNVTDTPWQDGLASPHYRAFGEQKSRWNDQCGLCPYLDFCAGDCLKHRFYGGIQSERLSFLCEGWKRFYNHSHGAFKEIAASTFDTNCHSVCIRPHRGVSITSFPEIALPQRKVYPPE